jgi:hypothetical protein
MFSFLKKPYPYNSFSLRDIYSNGLIACFVAIFLIVFQPFDISIWETDHKLLKLIGFGCVCFVCTMLFRLVSEVILKKQKPEETWTVWKEIVTLILVLLFIAYGNLCYSNFIGISHFGIKQLFFALIATLLLGFFPIMANITLKYNRFVVLNQKDAELMEAEVISFQNRVEAEGPVNEAIEQPKSESEILILIAENDKDKIELKPEELLYIESADNYSTITFYRNQKVNKQLLRGSLKRIESQIIFPFIVRCHRSYIVNLKQVNHIKGNAQGYRIDFKYDLNDTVPVSRNYSKALFERLVALK